MRSNATAGEEIARTGVQRMSAANATVDPTTPRVGGGRPRGAAACGRMAGAQVRATAAAVEEGALESLA